MDQDIYQDMLGNIYDSVIDNRYVFLYHDFYGFCAKNLNVDDPIHNSWRLEFFIYHCNMHLDICQNIFENIYDSLIYNKTS